MRTSIILLVIPKLKALSFHLVLPLILSLYAVFGIYSHLKASEFGILNLDYRGKSEELISTRSGELLAGDKVWGKFHTTYPNLGIISIRFYNQDRDSNDTLIFRLKRKGSESWYYQAEYKTDQFLPHKHFPFGFPVIANSDGGDFVFELESKYGATGSGILIDYQKPVFVAKSGFTKAEFAQKPKLVSYFVSQKIMNIFGDQDTKIIAFFYLLPLIFMAVYFVSDGLSFHFLLGTALLFTIWDTFYLKESFDPLFIAILFFYALISRRFRLESRISAVFALAYLCLTPILLILKQDAIAEKAAVWAYLFLCITVFQQIYELK